MTKNSTTQRKRPSLWKRLAAILGLVCLISLSVARTAQAVEFDEDGVIPAGEVIDDDVFISTGTILIDGTVNGDLFLNGATVTVNGPVQGNLIVSGSTLVLNGPVGGSLIFTGQTATINAKVEGSIYAMGMAVDLGEAAVVGNNLYFVGFGISTENGSQVERDVLMTGYQAVLHGETGRHVQVDVSALELGGVIGGDVNAIVSKPDQQSMPPMAFPNMPTFIPAGLRVLESADIQGKLTYTSPVEQAEAIASQPAGGIEYRLPETTQKTPQVSFTVQFGNWIAGRIRSLVTLLVLGSLIAWLLPAPLQMTADKIKRKPLQSLGGGLLAFIAAIVIASALLFTLLLVWLLLSVVTLSELSQVIAGIGFGVWGLGATIIWALIVFGSILAVSYLVGDWLFRRFSPAYAGPKYWPLIVGIFIFVAIQGIPCLGLILHIILAFMGFGAMVLLVNDWRVRRRSGPPTLDEAPPAIFEG